MFFFVRIPELPTARPSHNTRVTPQSTSPTTTRSRVQVVYCNASVDTDVFRSMTPREESGSKQGTTCNQQRLQRGNGRAQNCFLLWRRGAVAFLTPCTWKDERTCQVEMLLKVWVSANKEVWCTTVEDESASLQTVTNTLRSKPCSHNPMFTLTLHFCYKGSPSFLRVSLMTSVSFQSRTWRSRWQTICFWQKDLWSVRHRTRVQVAFNPILDLFPACFRGHHLARLLFTH